MSSSFFFFNDTATTEIYTLSLHDALPIFEQRPGVAGARLAAADRLQVEVLSQQRRQPVGGQGCLRHAQAGDQPVGGQEDRKSTRLNSSHANISYAVFCLKKKNDCISCAPT